MEKVLRDSSSSFVEREIQLKREIGLFDGINIIMGIMIGSGIFYLGSYVLMRSGMSLGLSIAVWIIGGFVTLLSGLCYAELGTMMPKAGGSYIYQREAYGSKWAFVGGLSSFVIGSCGSTAALAIAFPTALSNLIPISDPQIKIIAVISIMLLTVINIIGVKQGAMVQNIFTIGKLIPIGLILFTGLFLGKETPSLSLIPATENISISSILGMIGFGVVATLWAYEGWTNLNNISEEIKNPSKNIPRSIIFSIVIVTTLYALFNFALYRVIPYDRITSLINSKNYYLGTEAAGILFGSTGSLIVGSCMAISIFGALNGCVIVFPRKCFAMARDGYLPKVFAQVHPQYQTPYTSLIVHMVIAIALVLMRNLDQMTSLVIFSGMIFNALTFYSVIVLRKKYPNMERPYKVKTWMVYITIAIMVALTTNTLYEDPITSIIGLIVPAICYVIYIFIDRKNQNTRGI